MAFLSDTHAGPAANEGGHAGGTSSMIRGMAEFFAVLGAAIRVANAVEAHRDPKTEDLRTLGIEQPLPRSF